MEQWGALTDPHDDDARSRALKRSTLLLRRNHVRSAITMAIAQGRRVEDIRSLADLVRPSIVKSVFRGFHAKHGGTANSYVSTWRPP